MDLKLRYIESNIQTITAGNGAIYAVKNKRYVHLDPIYSHDSVMPLYYALQNETALYNPNAVAYEKAGENVSDEFKRKVRMNRYILKSIFPDISILNFMRFKWFTYFYLGHRTARYLLWASHITLFISSLILAKNNLLLSCIFALQLVFYCTALLTHFTNLNSKISNLIYYYVVTLVAQTVGVYNIITGKSKPFWEKAESTR